MKKVGLVLGVVLIVFVGALLAAPLFVDIDRFRPQIQETANKSVKGQIELGRLSFRLFPNFRIQVEGVRATPQAPMNDVALFEMKTFDLRLPLLSILTGPKLTVELLDANIVLQTQGDKTSLDYFLLDVEKLVDAQESSALQDTELKVESEAAQTQAIAEILSPLPRWIQAIILGAEMNFALRGSSLELKDREQDKNQVRVSELDLILSNLGLDKEMGIEFAMNPQVVMDDLSVGGRLSNKGSLWLKPTGENNQLDIDWMSDLSEMEIKKGVLFHKPKGTALGAGLKGKLLHSKENIAVDFSELFFEFANFRLGGSLSVGNLTQPESAQMKTRFTTAMTQIAPFGVFVPLIRDFKLQGSFGMDIQARGALLDPAFRMQIALNDIGGATPELQHPLSDLNGEIKISGTAKNPVVEIDLMSMRIASSDLSFKMRSEGIEPINARVELRSKVLNVDELLGLEALIVDPEQMMAAGAAAGSANDTAQSAAVQTQPTLPLDHALVAMAPIINEQLANPMLDQVGAQVAVHFQKITLLGAVFDNGVFNLNYAKRRLQIPKSGIGGYGGRVEFEANLHLNPQNFEYSFGAGLRNVMIERMLASHVPGWKKVASGSMVGSFAVQGKGLTQTDLEKNLSGHFRGELVNGRFVLPIQRIVGLLGDQVSEKVQSFIPAGLTQQLAPALQAELEKLKSRPQSDQEGAFKTLSIASTIQGRKLIIQNLDVLYDGSNLPTRDIQYKSTGQITFDQEVELVGAAMFDPTVVRLHDLRGPSGKVELPIRVAGPMSEPKPDYQYTLDRIGAVYANIAKRALGQKADELKREAERHIREAQQKLEAEARARAAAERQKAEAAAKKEGEKAIQKGAEELKKRIRF